MRVVVDRPADHQVWDRAEPVAGWVEGVADIASLRATCGGVALTVRPCPHPRDLERRDVHGFWTEVVVQRHLGAVRDGRLLLELWRGDVRLATVPLWISPFALDLARSHPLDLAEYAVPPAPQPSAPAPRTLVFPGLGAVGGSSLNRLLRAKMLRAGWPTPVYDEANVPGLWSRVQARWPALPWRWIDGHDCRDARPVGTGEAVRVTLLRDPIRRLASIFNYGVLVHPEEFAGGTFDDFVAAGAGRRHSQAAGLVRLAGSEPPRRDAALLRAAHAELVDSHALVGITERFEETILLLAQLAGYDTIGMWRSVLAAPRAVDPERLSTAARRRLSADLAVDLELYEEFRARFEQRVAAAALGPALERYRAAAARQPALPAAAKAVECMRWRLVLAEHRQRPVGSLMDLERGVA